MYEVHACKKGGLQNLKNKSLFLKLSDKFNLVININAILLVSLNLKKLVHYVFRVLYLLEIKKSDSSLFFSIFFTYTFLFK